MRRKPSAAQQRLRIGAAHRLPSLSNTDTAVGGAAQQFGGFRALHDGKHGAEGVTLNKDASEGARDGPKGAHPINWARLWPLTTVLAHGSVDAARLP